MLKMPEPCPLPEQYVYTTHQQDQRLLFPFYVKVHGDLKLYNQINSRFSPPYSPIIAGTLI